MAKIYQDASNNLQNTFPEKSFWVKLFWLPNGIDQC
jgi:hypothetical protein